jgi:hypothetical protein
MSPRPKLRRHSPQDRAYLRMLADKIRDARAQRGMTRSREAMRRHARVGGERVVQ